jgi:hypothetical protein
MTTQPYWYLVRYDESREDLQAVLDTLRAREFAAGRYNPVMPSLDFVEPAFSRQYRKAQHDSIEDAIMDAEEEGTRSILDIHRIDIRPDFGVAAPLPRAALLELYKTERPSEDAVRANKEFLRWAAPAQCIYIVIYEGDRTQQVLFAGRSFG